MQMQKLRWAMGFALSVALVVVGGFLSGLYFVGVVQIIVEEPADRSWLFWGLPLAFIGLSLLASGVILAITISILSRKKRGPATP